MTDALFLKGTLRETAPLSVIFIDEDDVKWRNISDLNNAVIYYDICHKINDNTRTTYGVRFFPGGNWILLRNNAERCYITASSSKKIIFVNIN